MLILTAKFNRKKAVAIVLALAVLLIVIILIAANTGKNNANETAALSAVVKNNEQRVNYLNALGWEVDKNALEEQEVVIPRAFNDVYADYNALQKAQGFDLTQYGGLEAMRYTYKVLNYPGADGTVVADIIVYKNEVIAGDVQSNALDGFMVGLEYPKTDTVQTVSSDAMLTDETLEEDAMLTDASAEDAAMAPTEVPDNTADVAPSDNNAQENTAENSEENTAENVPGENAAAEDEAALPENAA